jgi:hypothetical protein
MIISVTLWIKKIGLFSDAHFRRLTFSPGPKPKAKTKVLGVETNLELI